MIMKKSLFVLLVVFAEYANAQLICKGSITDSLTGKGVEFSNVGVIGKGIGTVTDENGRYHFVLPDSLKNQLVKVSMIGYKSKTIKAEAFANMNGLLLQQEATNLGEVAVKAKKSKVKIIGNQTTTKSVSAGFTKNNLGAEMAIRLNIKHQQTHLKKLMFQINSSTLDKAIFRLNIYSVDEKGNPGNNILKDNIIIEPKEKTGLVSFDLMPYNIFVDDDVFIALEWIKDLGDAKGLYFSSKLVGSSTYFRQASQDSWHKTTPVGVGLHMEVAY